jgi:signal transduction histidine kinase
LKLVAESEQLSFDLSKEIRTLSYLLHPPLLDEAGLKSALEWYAEGFSKRSGIAINLEVPQDLTRLPRTLEMVIFRVVQESLANIHRHANSPSAEIRLTRSDDNIHVEIVDRGKGISPERLRQMSAVRVGVGVRGMEERVRQFGGTLRVESSSAGTQVHVVIPVASDQPEAAS